MLASLRDLRSSFFVRPGARARATPAALRRRLPVCLLYSVCEYPVLSIVNARAQDADAGSARNKARNPSIITLGGECDTVSVCYFEFAMYGFITSNQHA
jgi:hypothetical protein